MATATRPRGRPNEMEPALLLLAKDRGAEGFTLPEAAKVIPAVANGRRTYRAMAMAAERLAGKGVLVVTHPDGSRHPRFRHADL